MNGTLDIAARRAARLIGRVSLLRIYLLQPSPSELSRRDAGINEKIQFRKALKIDDVKVRDLFRISSVLRSGRRSLKACPLEKLASEALVNWGFFGG
jgi:hypothetical protein